jgi:predicted dehydrogenase
MKKIGMGLIGPGFVAAHHLDAVRRLGDVEIIAIAGSSQESTEKKARAYKVDRAYGDYKALIADPDVQVIHNTTPNHLHLPTTMMALQAGKHVISDKPRCCGCRQSRACCDFQLSREPAGAASARNGGSR